MNQGFYWKRKLQGLQCHMPIVTDNWVSFEPLSSGLFRCGSRIWSRGGPSFWGRKLPTQRSGVVRVKQAICAGADPGFGQGGTPASEAKSCWHSEAESCERSKQSAAGVQGPLKGPGSFWVFDAQICILTHSRDSFSLIFDIYFDTKSW